MANALAQLPQKQHHRFVPCEASLQSDAPGWNNDHTNVSSINNVNSDQDKRSGSQDSNADGPICWKCKNQNPNTSGHSEKTTEDTTTRNMSKRKQRKLEKKQNRIHLPCSVCRGKGRLPISQRQQTNPSPNGQSSKEAGVVKRARPNPPGFVPRGPMAVALKSSNDEDQGHAWVSQIQQADAGLHDVWVPASASSSQSTTAATTTAPPPCWLPRPGEQLVKLLGHWRILQRIGSHRWTTDDLVTAYVAATTARGSRSSVVRYLDLGCGNGSVLQMVSWAILEQQQQEPTESCFLDTTGVEARSEAVALARRSLAFNVGSTPTPHYSVQIHHADFRQFVTMQNDEKNGTTPPKYDLITGTPPYFRVNFTTTTTTTTAAVQSTSTTITTSPNNIVNHDDDDQMANQESQIPIPDSETVVVVDQAVIQQGGMPTSIQSAPARCEFRGGIEAYCQAAAPLLEPQHGRFVVCNSFVNHQRSQVAAHEAGLDIVHTVLVEGCRGRGILFVVYVMKLRNIDKSDDEKSDIVSSETEKQQGTEEKLTVREVSGKWSDEYVKKVFARMSIPGPIYAT